MRHLSLFLVLIFSLPVMAQSSEMDQIKRNFKQQYPNAQDVEWEVEDDYVEVEFDKDGYEMEAIYSMDGTLKNTYVEVNGAELPLVVYEAIARDYAGYELDDVEEEESAGMTVYQVEVESENEEWELVYDARGNLMTKELDEDL